MLWTIILAVRTASSNRGTGVDATFHDGGITIGIRFAEQLKIKEHTI